MRPSAKLTTWIKMGGDSGARAVRFRLPAEARMDDSAVLANMICIRLRSPDDSPPDVLLTCQPAADFGGTLRSALRQQRAAAAKYADRRLRRCTSMSLRQSRCGHVEILDKETGHLKVSYIRIIGTAAVVCGYLTRPRSAERAELDRAARVVITSVETQPALPARGSKPAVRRGVIRFHGFSAKPPDGWERQDTMGLVILFGPGDGFRPRIVINRSDEEEGWDSTDEPLNALRLAFRGMFNKTRFDKPTSVKVSGRRGTWLAVRGTKPDGKRIESVIVAVAYRKRGIVFQYTAASAGFQRWLPLFQQFLKTIVWRP